jgi:hypothetical protein
LLRAAHASYALFIAGLAPPQDRVHLSPGWSADTVFTLYFFSLPTHYFDFSHSHSGLWFAADLLPRIRLLIHCVACVRKAFGRHLDSFRARLHSNQYTQQNLEMWASSDVRRREAKSRELK